MPWEEMTWLSTSPMSTSRPAMETSLVAPALVAITVVIARSVAVHAGCALDDKQPCGGELPIFNGELPHFS
jgi:hypothetical protein